MAKESKVKTFFTITDVQTKTVLNKVFRRYVRLALVAVRFRRGDKKWQRAYQIEYEGPISLERFIEHLKSQNIEPNSIEKRMTETLEPYIGQELELKDIDTPH